MDLTASTLGLRILFTRPYPQPVQWRPHAHRHDLPCSYLVDLAVCMGLVGDHNI